MFLRKLHLLNFKNYTQADLVFSQGVNCFTGNNGSGKTNLLDAIHYLSLCKSALNPSDSQNIKHGDDLFVIQGFFDQEGKEEAVYCSFRKGERKIFSRNQKEYPRLAEHIGHFPVVMISPEDAVLVSGGSEERRKLFDTILAQFDRSYLDHLIIYNKALAHRNSLLKQFALSGKFDEISLEVWDEQLIVRGQEIYAARTKFMNSLHEKFKKNYAYLTDGLEEAGIEYTSHLHDGNMRELLISSREKDRAMQYTTAGIHKDDLLFQLNGYPVKKFGSQGQQKTFLAAIRLAQYELIAEAKGFKPILLLDDIFDKLDDHRISRLMELAESDHTGQIFLTDSHPDRAIKYFKEHSQDVKVFEVEKGVVKSTETASI